MDSVNKNIKEQIFVTFYDINKYIQVIALPIL